MRETYEVEVKLRIENEGPIIKSIIDNGGKRLNTEIQSDMYFDHPCRSFSETDESVRVRTRTSPVDSEHRSKNPAELTYKGPKIDMTTKTRLEFTSEVDNIDSVISFLQHTGFKHVATIIKNRDFYCLDDITISIDSVDKVGLYIEFELIAQDKVDMVRARERIIELIEKLRLDPAKTIRESYLELYLKHA
ncbi:class IV adenylate cyclase [Candidatus Thorarchaeota archaeon]|nr:MAG: class IV adenylate cyclase [Candidatus Thorarchaeota archaeon]